MTTYCLFCYKPNFPDENTFPSSDAHFDGSLLAKFIKQLNSKISRNFLNCANVGACVHCAQVLEIYCDLRLELECIQMKIHWQLKTLKQVMQQATKVPNRLETFKQNLFPDFKCREEELDGVLDLRHNIYKACSQRVRKPNPVVRLDISSSVDIKAEQCKNEDSDPEHEFQEENILNQPEGLQNEETKAPVVLTSDESTHSPKLHETVDNSNSPEVTLTTTLSEIDSESSTTSSSTINSSSTSGLKKKLRSIFKCAQCQRTFSSRNNLTQHEANQSCKTVDSDSDSGAERNIPRRKRRNQSVSSEDKYAKDDYSSDTSYSDSASSYDDEIEKKQPEYSYNEKKPEVALQDSDGQKTFCCPVENCKVAFELEIHLQLHQKLHGNFTCSFCDFKCDFAKTLFNHEFSEHTDKPKEKQPFQCSRCSKTFTKRFSARFERHFYVKHLQMDYSNGACPTCKQKFTILSTTFEKTLALHYNQTMCKPKDGTSCHRKAIKCPEENCEEMLKSRKWLHTHLKLHGNFSCKFCDFEANLADKLLEHEWSNHTVTDESTEKIKCPRCPVTFSSKQHNYNNATRSKHFFRTHLGLDYTHGQCSVCGFKFGARSGSLKQTMEVHMKLHDTSGKNPNEIFICDLCNAPFITSINVRIHKLRVHKVSSLECPVCKKAFTKAGSLESHVKTIHKTFEMSDSAKNSFRCPVKECGRLFLHKYSFDKHMEKNRLTMLMCSVCGKWIMNHKNNMKMHMLKHSRNNKSFSTICDLCGKRFYGKRKCDAENKLQVHLNSKMHSVNNQGWELTCELCGKLCNTEFKLEEHLRTHTREMPFLCNVCGREFSIKWNLKRHIKLVHDKP